MGLVCQASQSQTAVNPGEAEQQVFNRRIEAYAVKCAAAWAEAKAAPHEFGVSILLPTKLEHERRADRYVDEMEGLLRRWPASPAKRGVWRQNLLDALRRMAGDYLECEADGLNRLFTAEAMEATRQFVREARAFAPAMTDESLFQALRNLWVTHSVQLFLQTPIARSPAMFAYSMLYPWTDNCLDSPRLTRAAKIAFGDWLALRLRGVKAAPQNHHAEQVRSEEHTSE